LMVHLFFVAVSLLRTRLPLVTADKKIKPKPL